MEYKEINNKFGSISRFTQTLLVIFGILILSSCDGRKTGKDTKSETVVKVSETKTVEDKKSEPQVEVIENIDFLFNPTTEHLGKAVKGYEKLGVFVKHQLKDSTDLLILSKGFEKQLIDFIESDKPADKKSWFNLRRILFKPNSSDLDNRSGAQIDNVAKILKIYPNIELRIGGYTNNTDEAFEIAETASARRRAKALLNALVLKGINVERLTSEGYGTKHAIADNNTAEGRALNRRVAARVYRK